MIFFKRFFAILKVNLIIFLQNIKYPKRYLLKVKHFQRPLFFLKLRRFFFSLFNPISFSTQQYYSLNQLFKKGITSYYDEELSEILLEIGRKYSTFENFSEGDEISCGYISHILPNEFQDKIIPKILPIAALYFGSNSMVKIRSAPRITYISRKTVENSTLNSSTDFWHIDTTNQLTMHMLCTDVDKSTPNLGYSSSLHNINLIDVFNISKNKNSFSFYKNKLKHKNLFAYGKAGTISIFDPNGMHIDLIPKKSLKPRIYIHINFTPGNF